MTNSSNRFAMRVGGIFATRVVRFGIGFVTSFLLAGLLMPEGRGQYALLVLVPTMLNALGQLGLPSAMSFFAGRGARIDQLERLGWFLTIVLSVVLVGGTVALLPWLHATFLEPVSSELILVSLASVPFTILTSFSSSTLIGRQRLRNYNLIIIGQSVLMLAGVLLLVGVLDLGVVGAISSYVAVAILTAIAMMVDLRSLVRAEPHTGPAVSLGSFVSYGIRIYPASVTGYFSYRADVLILSAMLGDAAAVGLYTFAVSLAELIFMVPDSVSTVFYPHVAGLERVKANALAPQVSRFTVMLTGLAAIVLIPAAWIATHLILPAYADSMIPFFLLLPGVIALSVSKVLAGYISGLGLPLLVARASIANLVVNLIANVILIPIIGIAGAALSSLISYSVHAAILAATASRIARTRPLDYVIPTSAEARRLVETLSASWRRFRTRG